MRVCAGRVRLELGWRPLVNMAWAVLRTRRNMTGLSGEGRLMIANALDEQYVCHFFLWHALA